MCQKYSERCSVRIGVIGDSLSDEYQGVVSAVSGLDGVAVSRASGSIVTAADGYDIRLAAEWAV